MPVKISRLHLYTHSQIPIQYSTVIINYFILNNSHIYKPEED